MFTYIHIFVCVCVCECCVCEFTGYVKAFERLERRRAGGTQVCVWVCVCLKLLIHSGFYLFIFFTRSVRSSSSVWSVAPCLSGAWGHKKNKFSPENRKTFKTFCSKWKRNTYRTVLLNYVLLDSICQNDESDQNSDGPVQEPDVRVMLEDFSADQNWESHDGSNQRVKAWKEQKQDFI